MVIKKILKTGENLVIKLLVNNKKMDNERKNKISIPAIIVAVLVITGILLYKPEQKNIDVRWHPTRQAISEDESESLVSWGDLGLKMVEAGVIDKGEFEDLYSQRGGLDEKDEKIVYGYNEEKIIIDSSNSAMMLNMLWGLGLSNKNPILENGPMVKQQGIDGASKFASTGGWSLAKGNPMDHYSMHSFIILNKEQQLLVEKASKNIFRPCCGNSTYFPDCNHGMAMLGFIELMASQGASESQIYVSALKINKFWFPEQYQNVAIYLNNNGENINTVDPKKILSSEYISSRGYKNVLAAIEPVQQKNTGSCGV